MTMKKILMGVFLLVTAVGMVNAQMDTPKKELKKANRSLGSYLLDPAQNADELKEAREKIEYVIESGEFSTDAEAWILRGQIYNEIALSDSKAYALNPDSFEPKHPKAAVIAYNSFKKGLEHAEKGYHEDDALTGMRETSNYLNNLGLMNYNRGKFELAYKMFDAALDIHNTLVDRGEDPTLATEDDYNNQVYITALSGLNANMAEASLSHFLYLEEKGFDKPAVYEGLFTIYSQKGQDDKAREYLEEGREKYPDDTSLLFASINYYLKKGELENLIDKLKLALEKEPDNVSIYTTLGNVYDNLYQRAVKDTAVSEATAKEYFDSAKKYYNEALELDPNNALSTYSLGALYYNKAAVVVDEMNKYASDLSKKGMMKYDSLKAEMEMLFDKALPYFLKAEELDPTDQNTLIALKEIYARKNMMEKSTEYKQKLEALLGNDGQ